jgi:hypothetical protein
MKMKFPTVVLVVLSQFSAAYASCPAVKTTPVFDKGASRLVREAASFVVYKSQLRVNTDGAPDSYHPIGKSKGALNTICNGIAVTPAAGPFKGERITSIAPEKLSANERCQIILDIFRESRDAGYSVPKGGSIDWYALAMEPGPHEVGFYRPCVQQVGKTKGFFVAQTALVADASKSVCDPAHWMNSNSIPYITLPKGSKVFSKANVQVGDLALVQRRVDGSNRSVIAIVADVGNAKELGEGSIALHEALGNHTAARIPNNLPADVTTFIIKDSKPTGVINLELLSNSDLKDTLIAKIGGPSVVADCLK